MSTDPTPTPASLAFDEAFERAMAGRSSPYPNGAHFVNAESPNVGRAIADAAEEGRAVVLCYRDGTRRIVEAGKPVTTS